MSNKQLAIALYKATKDISGKDLESVLSQFVRLLVAKHKIKSADKIIAEFEKYAKNQDGIMEIEICSARDLENKVVDEIKKIFGKLTESVQTVNKSIIGGVIIKTEEVIFDGSLRMQIQRLKNSFN